MAGTVVPYLFQQARSALARFTLLAGLGTLALSATSCASAGNFTWYRDVPNADWRTDVTEYVIGVGDTVSIRVYEQDGLSATGKIRRDGRIALPLAGEVVAAGKHPSQLARELEGRLKEFIVTPRVTVNVDQSQPVTVTALGEIKNVGALTLEPPARLVEAIAQAGGPGEFADKTRIFVLRQFPEFQRIRFTYDAIVHNEGGAAGFPLRTGDVIVIE
ncbi:MAG TPA: polysaccharide biosynthesis/export family protein [Polyangiaceae bacterium]|jgi:polysaccharide export outer membrane protein|nr:polysaccharide biosynthesis/export family protein [Polyangiaceae bacterium]